MTRKTQKGRRGSAAERSERVVAGYAAAVGFAAGTATGYLLDPAQGRRRRAFLRDKLVHVEHASLDEARTVARDARSRASGLGHRVAHPFGHRSNGNGQVAEGSRPELLQEVWSPSARAAAVAGGTAAAGWGLRHGGPPGWAALLGGAVLTARAWANEPLRRLTGIGAGPAAVRVTKTINIAAPVDEVYGLWNAPAKFPLFMTNVQEVHEGNDDRTHWKVRGPAGTTLEWDAEITEREPNRLIAWETYPGSLIQHAGRVLFEPKGESSTRVTVQLSYNPALGVAGHTVAKLLGRHPKRQLDEDLLRLKNYLETGSQPHDAAAATT